MKKILIATSNVGKFSEIKIELEDLPFDFVNLKDLELDNLEVEEPYNTTWENALVKARFFAKKSKLLTIAEDTGLFVNYLEGAPGVLTKRYGATEAERNKKFLVALKGVPKEKRGAYFEAAGCVYDPSDDNFSIFFGKTKGRITETIGKKSRIGLGYDSIFYFPLLKKTFAELSLLEKNSISHRGKMINHIKYFLMKHHEFKQIICVAGIIIKDKKMLVTKRRDLRPEFNNKWEFPGGGVENGETFAQTLQREVEEETGYDILKKEQLPDIPSTIVNCGADGAYQVHLVLYICKIKSGQFKLADAETSDHGWYTYKEALKLNFLPLNKKSFHSKSNRIILKKYLD
ncbi:MAG: non-canonical purine NTP pyrophosphatase [Patescibacteria group bacterium]